MVKNIIYIYIFFIVNNVVLIIYVYNTNIIINIYVFIFLNAQLIKLLTFNVI